MFKEKQLLFKKFGEFEYRPPENNSDKRIESSPKLSIEETQKNLDNSIKELEKLRGYPDGFLNTFILNYPEIEISELDDLLQKNRNVIPDELCTILERFTFLNFDIVKTIENSSNSYDYIVKINKKDFEKNFTSAKKDIATFVKWWDILEAQNPEKFQKIQEQYPDISAKIAKVLEQIKSLNNFLQTIDDDQFFQYLDEILITIEKYNKEIAYINNALVSLTSIIKEEEAEKEKGIDIQNLTESEKEELKRFAKELYNEFFPPSYLDKAILFYTGQKELEGYQKILASGGNGIEMAIKGAIALFDLDTYTDAYDGAETILGLSSEEATNLLKSIPELIKQIDTEDSVSAAITLIYAVIIFKGGVKNISKFAQKLNYSEKLPKLIKTLSYSAFAHFPEKVGRALPLTMLATTALPYIKLAEAEL